MVEQVGPYVNVSPFTALIAEATPDAAAICVEWLGAVALQL